MQQNYAMVSGVIPGSGRYQNSYGKTSGNTKVITILCFTVTTVARLLAGSPPEHGNALPASILNHDSPPDWQGRFPKNPISE
jgi:hypothetical protein